METDEMHTVGVMRVPLSLPCQVPVLPGTGDVTAPIEERTERCATDAWWLFGRAMVCTEHLRVLLGDHDFNEFIAGMAAEGYGELSPSELLPWEQRHRYEQSSVGEL